MKKAIYILTIVGSLFLTSCKDYFESDQTGLVEEEVFYKSLNNLRIALNSVYNLLQSRDYQLSEIIFGEAMSDNAWNMQDVEVNDMSQLLNFQFNTQNPYILQRYRVNYQGINKCNQIIRSAPYVDYRANGTSEKEIREVLGQAKLFRAMFYFNLVKTFGGVSIQPEDVNLGNMVVPRSSIDDVYAYIEKDLREASIILRRTRYQLTEAGQVGAGGGLGMLLKVLVYQASPGIKVTTVNKDAKWQEARRIGEFFLEGKDISYNEILKFDENYADESWEELSKRLLLDPAITKETVFAGQDVVSMHQLDEFDKIFRLEGEFSPESIIEINHYDFSASGISTDESWPCYGSMMNRLGGTASTIAVTPTSDLNNEFQNDPRQMYTITGRSINRYYQQEEPSPEIGWFNYGNGLIFVKYYVFRSEGSAKGRNYRVMRLPEVMLLFAEALNETGDSRKAADYVNKIRQRARKLMDPSNPNSQYISIPDANFKDVAYAPYDIIRNAILKEKRIEMAGEFDRWFELARLGILAERMSAISKTAPVEQPSGKIRVKGRYFKKGVNELFPIPQDEILISNGVIEQNFGY